MKPMIKKVAFFSLLVFLLVPLPDKPSGLDINDTTQYQSYSLPSYQQSIGIEKLGSIQSIDLPTLYQQVVPSTVTVLNYSTTDSIQSIGSGVIYLTNQVQGNKVYYIITNHHVVRNQSKLRILTYDNLIKDALLIGVDSVQDVALLMVTSYGLQDSQVAILPSSDIRLIPVPQPLDPVFAIGNPSSPMLKGTLTAGVISHGARNTSGESTAFYSQSHAIQVDLALNPGNSGGPLFNALGQVIGINTYKINQVSNFTFEGLNFAMPIHDMLLGAERIRSSAQIALVGTQLVVNRAGTFFKPSYGAFEMVSLLQISLADRQTLNIPASIYQGVLLKGVGVNSAFGQVNVPRYAIITEMNGFAIFDIVDARRVMIRAQASETIEIKYYAPTSDGYETTLTTKTITARAS